MNAQLDTPNREAFQRYREAISFIDGYRASGNRELVEKGDILLEAAHAADPSWIRPIYLKSILKDLAGDPQAAINELEQFEDVSDLGFGLEVKINLGTAHYHRYSEGHLKLAETLFEEVKLKASKSLEPLSILASSYLAQVYAMGVVLKRPDEYKELKHSAKKCYDVCIREVRDALGRLEKWKKSKRFKPDLGEGWLADEIEWAAKNAEAFSGYFWTDYLTPKDRIHILERSITLLQDDLKLRPNHWATLSNLASAQMRLGYALRAIGKEKESAQLFREAENHIDLVLTPRIRPNYAFALYERGRILRLNGQFEEAIRSLQAVLELPEAMRDVSRRTVQSEIDLATQRQSYFLRKAA